MATPPAPSRPSRIVNLAAIVLAFGLLALTISQNRAELARLFNRPLDFRLLGVGLLIYIASMINTFGRWYLLVRVQTIPLRLRDALRLGFIGNLFNLVIPGAVGGDLIKAAYLDRMHPQHRASVWASIILDRILGLLGLFLLAGCAGLVGWPRSKHQVRTLILLVWAAIPAGVVALGVAFSPALYRLLYRMVQHRRRLATLVRRLEAIGLAYRNCLGTVVLALASALVSHALFVLAFFAASAALFDAMPSLSQHYLMVPLILFSTAVPIPFGALGFSEQISGQLFALVDYTDGAVAMMAFRVLMYASGASSALIYLGNLRRVGIIQAESDRPLKDPPRPPSQPD